MGKGKLKQYIVDATGVTPQEAGVLVDVVIQGMTNGLLKEGKLSLPNFGSFRVKDAEPRMARNPRTGDQVYVAARNVLRFKVARKLKGLIN